MATVTTPAGTINNTNIPAEFQQLPLHAIIAEPLMATVDAQAKSALATQNFIQSFMQPVAGSDGGQVTPVTVNFTTSIADSQDPTKNSSVSVSAPLLSMVPIPNLLIDSLDINFKYEVSQVITSTTDSSKTLNGNLNAKIGLAAWGANLTLSGTLTNDSKQSNTVNRSGALDISVHASQAPIPEGLAKIMSIMSSAVLISTGNALPAPQPAPAPTPAPQSATGGNSATADNT